jgi:hypothetical protein
VTTLQKGRRLLPYSFLAPLRVTEKKVGIAEERHTMYGSVACCNKRHGQMLAPFWSRLLICIVPPSLACAQPTATPARPPAPSFGVLPFQGPVPAYPQLQRSPLDALSTSPPTNPLSPRNPKDRQTIVLGLPATGPAYFVDLDARFDSPLIVALPATKRQR